MRSLRARLTLLAVVILGASLGIAAFIAYELLLLAGRSDLDEVLRREHRRFDQSISTLLADRAPDADSVQRVQAAAEEYLRLHPDTDTYLTVIRIDQQVLTAQARGPEALEDLVAQGRLPATAPGELVTVHTPAGEVRSLTIQVPSENAPVTFQVAGPLQPIRADALQALLQLLVASALSLGLGTALMTVVLRSALRPLHSLADTARVIDFDDLRSRVPYADRPDEVGVLAREFNGMLERLQRAAAGRAEFLASVSHELRTPLTIALGHLETLERIGIRDPALIAETTTVVRDELARMSRMIDDLLALARSEAIDFVVTEPIALPAFCAELELRVAGLQIDGVQIEQPPDVRVRADPDRLAQAVLNLVLNARTHTPPGTLVRVRAQADEQQLRIVVADDGGGIDPAIRDRVFEPFVSGSARASSSHGLGLAVVRAVALAHGGTVHLHSDEHGTTVTLCLPCASPPVRPPAVFGQIRAQTQGEKTG